MIMVLFLLVVIVIKIVLSNQNKVEALCENGFPLCFFIPEDDENFGDFQKLIAQTIGITDGMRRPMLSFMNSIGQRIDEIT